MMTLHELCQGVTTQPVPSLTVTGIACHSKRVQPGEVFVAVRGPRHDGHEFLEEAVRRGAAALVVERLPRTSVSCPVILVPDTKQALALMASARYSHPAQQLRFMGVTGTNGKTTTTYLLKAMLEAAGERVGLLGTVAYEIGQRHVPSPNTTPGTLELQRYLAEMVEQHLSWCVMEVSSHALDQGRVDGLSFDAAIFTNLGSDHLDYHQTREAYAQAKRRLFTYLRPKGRALINANDEYGQTLIETLGHQPLVSYGVEPAATIEGDTVDRRLYPHAPSVLARNVTCNWDGTNLILDSPWGTIPLHASLVGRHNVSNLVAAASACLSVGIETSAIRRALEDFPQVPGRLERMRTETGVLTVIDYAHTADALRLVLLSLRELVRGRLIVVFGCGGDRDQTKRPEMGRVASLLADAAILTSDNPRTEDPLDIIRQIKAGFLPTSCETQVIVDREQAIMAALAMARADDAVLIAGKGHEAYQIFDHVTVPFSDRDVVERVCSHTGKAVVVS